jgi:hypothetical protein
MPGPAPDPNALRRDRPADKDGWTSLPSEGRHKPAPAWPLAAPSSPEDEFDQADRELEVWKRVWKSAQAVAWEHNGSELEVALYVRHLVQAERGDMKAAAEARQWSDRLGLNPTAMLRLRWKIAADEVAAKRSTPVASPKMSASERLKARNAEAV